MKYILSLLLCFSCLYGKDAGICLLITVKNDESRIVHCLESAKPYIDCISVLDLGSTDDTVSFIEHFAKTNKIPCSFEIGNMNAIEAAQKALKSFGFSLFDSYLLFLDPNQVILTGSKIPSEGLSEDFYLVFEQFMGYSSYRPNFLDASLTPTTIAHLRDRNTPTISASHPKLKAFHIEGISDSNLEQNIEFFMNALSEDPQNGRYLVALGASYKAAKLYEDAIECFKKRIEMDGHSDELWFSRYMLGECYEQVGVWTQALTWYLDAYQFNPQRVESIKKISTYYRNRGHNELTYLFARHGIRIPHPDNNILFPVPPLYDFEFDEDLSIASYYTRFREDGYEAASNLLLRKDVPDWCISQCYRNILFYTKNLPGKYKPIQIPLPKVEGNEDRSYNPMNPSIVKIKDGYNLICRAVNYTQVGAKHFYTSDPAGFYRTKNFLIKYDTNFNILSQNEIVENLDRAHLNSYMIQGLEDCRIFTLGNSSWFTCTTFDTNPQGAIQISLAKLEEREVLDGEVINVERLVPLQGPDPHRVEKNWMPFVMNGEFYVIYSSDPLTIFKPNRETGECPVVFSAPVDHDLTRFRGSAAPIEFDDGYLLLIHEVVYKEDGTRVYLHRFVYYDREYKLSKVSKPFTFMHQGVEFCLEITIDHDGKNLIMPIGIEDREAYLVTVDLQDVRSLLGQLPSIYNPY